MTTFIDGPAAGKTLALERAPLFLRVVADATGKFDALDQLEDTATADEAIYVYRRNTDPHTIHIDGRDPKTGRKYGKWMMVCSYRLHIPRPDDSEVRDNASWRAWCRHEDAKGRRPL